MPADRNGDDLRGALEAARPKPKISGAEAMADVERGDQYQPDFGPTDEFGPPGDEHLNAGKLYDEDPTPLNQTGTRGIESTAEDVKHRSRGIPGAYSGEPEVIDEKDRNRNPSKA